MGRGRFLPMMIAACMVAGTAGAAGADTREEFRAAMRQARDGDLQADWSKMLDARERFAGFTANEELSALAHYYLGYTDWRLSALAFVATGPAASGRLAERAVASLEVAIQKRPQFLDAHALLVTCLATWLYADPSLREAILPRIQKAWDAALPGVASNPRVMLLRAMGLTVAPPPFGNREEGLELWRKAIQAFETDRPEPLMPDWGRVEAIAWLGGAHLAANRHGEAVELLERAVAMRPDFWWAAKAALPIARRPIAEK